MSILKIEDLIAIQRTIDSDKPVLNPDTSKKYEDLVREIIEAKDRSPEQKVEITREQALQLIVSLVGDADLLATRLVAEVRLDTDNKIGQIQSDIDQFLKSRVAEFIALTAGRDGINGADLQQLLIESINELATRYALTDEQRALLSRIFIAISEADFEKHSLFTQKEGEPVTEPKIDPKKILDPTKIREATPEEIQLLRAKELAELEEMLKERDEIKAKKAESLLKKQLKEQEDPDVSFVVDEFMEVSKVFRIKGRITSEQTGLPVPNIVIVGGLLGKTKTDENGDFFYENIPDNTVILIAPDSYEYTFKPPLHCETVTAPLTLFFVARPIVH